MKFNIQDWLRMRNAILSLAKQDNIRNREAIDINLLRVSKYMDRCNFIMPPLDCAPSYITNPFNRISHED